MNISRDFYMPSPLYVMTRSLLWEPSIWITGACIFTLRMGYEMCIRDSVNTTASIGGKTYAFDSNGVASEKQDSGTDDNDRSITFTWYEEKRGRNFTIMKELKSHPGVAEMCIRDRR